MINLKKSTTLLLALLLNVNSQAIDFETENKLKQLLENQSSNQTVLGENNDSSMPSLINKEDDIASKDEVKKFGFDYVKSIPTSISATADLPVPNGYTISIGDEVGLIITGTKNQTYRFRIGSDGSIPVPEVGNIQLAGLNSEEAQLKLNKIIESAFYGSSVEFFLGKLNAKKISIIGAVKSPGTYIVNPYTTISSALAFSGGLEDYASLRTIKLVKTNGTIFELDLYDLLVFGKRDNDIAIESGDTVMVSATDRFVSLEGQLLRPMIYEYLPGDNFSSLFNFALGLTRHANKKNIQTTEIENGVLLNKSITLESVIGERQLESIYINKLAQISKKGISVTGKSVEERSFVNSQFKTLDAVVNELKFSSNIYPFFARLTQDQNNGLRKQNHVFSLADPKSYEGFLLKENVSIIFFSREDIIDGQEIFNEIKVAGTALDEDNVNNDYKYINEDSYKEKLPLNKQQDKDFDDTNPLTLSNNDVTQSTAPQAIIEEEVYKDEFQNLKNLIDEIKPSDIKVIYFGSEPIFAPIAGDFTPQSIFEYFGKDINLQIEDVSVSTSENTINSSYQININSQKVIQVNFPEEKFSSFEVVISGQVANPGSYLVNSASTLNDLYIMAGGLSERASTKGIILSRESIKVREQQAVESAKRSLIDVIISQSSSGGQQLQSLIPIIEMSEQVDFVGRLTGNLAPDSLNSKSIFLEKGDTVFVPSKSNTVSVIGEVLQPSTTLFVESYTFNDYIIQSGKLTDFADSSSIYVIRADGTSILIDEGYFRKGYVPLPGDTIVVPRDIGKLSLIPLISISTKIISDVAFAAASLNSLNN